MSSAWNDSTAKIQAGKQLATAHQCILDKGDEGSTAQAIQIVIFKRCRPTTECQMKAQSEGTLAY